MKLITNIKTWIKKVERIRTLSAPVMLPLNEAEKFCDVVVLIYKTTWFGRWVKYSKEILAPSVNRDNEYFDMSYVIQISKVVDDLTLQAQEVINRWETHTTPYPHELESIH